MALRDVLCFQARLEFAFVYPDRMGRNVIRKVGSVWAAPYRGKHDDDSMSTIPIPVFELVWRFALSDLRRLLSSSLRKSPRVTFRYVFLC